MSSSNKTNSVCLLVFAKTPISGTVKTRMAPRLSADQCLELHRGLVRYTLSAVAGWDIPGLHRFALFTEKLLGGFKHLVPPNVQVDFQDGIDLGARMASALNEKWCEGYSKIVIIGTDSPLLERSDIESAIKILDNHQVVIGPTADGGYYLIGFSALAPSVFFDIDWGTPRVYQQTLKRIRQLALTCGSMRESFDLDTPEDLEEFVQRHMTIPCSLLRPSSQELFHLIRLLLGQSSVRGA